MKCRVARHTNDLEKIKNFYLDVLGFEFLGEFKNHDHYDGIFLGHSDCDWHLEFTKSDEPAIHTFNQDDMLVFYPENDSQLVSIREKIFLFKIEIEMPKNPYWKNNGTMIKDPDGFLIVIANIKR